MGVLSKCGGVRKLVTVPSAVGHTHVTCGALPRSSPCPRPTTCATSSESRSQARVSLSVPEASG